MLGEWRRNAGGALGAPGVLQESLASGRLVLALGLSKIVPDEYVILDNSVILLRNGGISLILSYIINILSFKTMPSPFLFLQAINRSISLGNSYSFSAFPLRGQ